MPRSAWTEDALREQGKPDAFNRDQGSQFSSEAFADVLKRESVDISMDAGRGLGQHLRRARGGALIVDKYGDAEVLAVETV